MGLVAWAPRDENLGAARVSEIGACLGCAGDIEAITQTLVEQTGLGDEAYAAVWSSVEHLVNHDTAWRSMERGVVPPALRAQALAVTFRTDPTKPADSVPAAVLAAVAEAVASPTRGARAVAAEQRRAHGSLALSLPRFASACLRAFERISDPGPEVQTGPPT